MNASANSSLIIGGNLLGSSQASAAFTPAGNIYLNASGTVNSPTLLGALSADDSNKAIGFSNNFAFGTLTVGTNDYVRLTNQSSSPKAVYTNSLILPGNSTLDLNGLNLYTRAAQIAGTVLNGSVTQIPDSGPLSLATPTPGDLATAGQLDEWTFYGNAGHTITVSVNPGNTGTPAPLSPQLNWVQVQLLDSSNNVLATAVSSSGGTIVTLSKAISADGTYKIHVSAAPGHLSSTGNYIVTAWDTTPNVQTLNLNQTETGTLATPFAQDDWTFATTSGQQIQFQLLNSSAAGITFSLTGPGYTGFTNISGNSNLLTLPASGNYTLVASSLSGVLGNYAFDVVETTVTPLTLGMPITAALAGSGQPQLFTVSMPSAAPMFIQLSDSTSADDLELYARFGSPPTRAMYDYGANAVGSSQSLLIPDAAAGTWYILVYAASVAAAPSSFTLQASASPVLATAVTPTRYGTNSTATLTITGAGFASNTTVALVGSNGTTVYPASSVTFDTFTQLTASVNLAGVPQGTYSIQVTNGSGGTNTLPNAFTVTAAGQADLVTQLILPQAVGRHIASTFYVEYSNTGTVAMPAPVILLESSVADDLPLFTLNPALQSLVSGPPRFRKVTPTRSRLWPVARCLASWSRGNRSRCLSITQACSSPGISANRNSSSTCASSRPPILTSSIGPLCNPRCSLPASRARLGPQSTGSSFRKWSVSDHSCGCLRRNWRCILHSYTWTTTPVWLATGAVMCNCSTTKQPISASWAKMSPISTAYGALPSSRPTTP